ncbi:unnamed protein product [Oikopleura dioica]|uniref:Uncharacterized protein n=1 Tax=Oikopleura dioica TaxID=34765 RepID=E4XCX6_OIKDI|nr:unnamed protein product [Oikopleura dioica]
MRIEILAPDEQTARPSFGISSNQLKPDKSNVSIRSGKGLASFMTTLEESEKRCRSNTNLGTIMFTSEGEGNKQSRKSTQFLQSGARLSVNTKKSAVGRKKVNPKGQPAVKLEVKESQAQRLKKIRHRMLYLAGMQYFAIFVASILMVVQGFKAYLASDNENMIGLGPIATGLILIMIPFYCGYLLLAADTMNNRALRKQKKKENKSKFIEEKHSDESLWSNFSF